MSGFFSFLKNFYFLVIETMKRINVAKAIISDNVS